MDAKSDKCIVPSSGLPIPTSQSRQAVSPVGRIECGKQRGRMCIRCEQLDNRHGIEVLRGSARVAVDQQLRVLVVGNEKVHGDYLCKNYSIGYRPCLGQTECELPPSSQGASDQM